ncbi:unnamed protein product [Amoebophrya sp. A120]|nr:unnamed protein product [Amoebophrya sp. A120]|eukprot:GSA120T00011613001.1
MTWYDLALVKSISTTTETENASTVWGAQEGNKRGGGPAPAVPAPVVTVAHGTVPSAGALVEVTNGEARLHQNVMLKPDASLAEMRIDPEKLEELVVNEAAVRYDSFIADISHNFRFSANVGAALASWVLTGGRSFTDTVLQPVAVPDFVSELLLLRERTTRRIANAKLVESEIVPDRGEKPLQIAGSTSSRPSSRAKQEEWPSGARVLSAFAVQVKFLAPAAKSSHRENLYCDPLHEVCLDVFSHSFTIGAERDTEGSVSYFLFDSMGLRRASVTTANTGAGNTSGSASGEVALEQQKCKPLTLRRDLSGADIAQLFGEFVAFFETNTQPVADHGAEDSESARRVLKFATYELDAAVREGLAERITTSHMKLNDATELERDFTLHVALQLQERRMDPAKAKRWKDKWNEILLHQIMFAYNSEGGPGEGSAFPVIENVWKIPLHL